MQNRENMINKSNNTGPEAVILLMTFPLVKQISGGFVQNYYTKSLILSKPTSIFTGQEFISFLRRLASFYQRRKIISSPASFFK